MAVATETTNGDGSPVPAAWSALGVRYDELGAVRGLFRVSFLLGLALVTFYSASNALFLTKYDIGVLPWVYIVNAAVVVIVGLGYSAASRRFAVNQVLVASTVASAVTVVGLWVWAVASDSDVVAFVMATTFRLLFIFAFLGLWEIASTIFDVRQAKRLFPAIALGVMVAFVIGGALTGPATSMIGTTNIVLVSGGFFAIYAVGFGRLLRVEMGNAVPDSTPPAGPRDILADRYSRLLAVVRSITILLIFVGEFIFYEQSAATFEEEESLATFLGLFIGGSTLLMVVVTAAFSARYIAHYGVRVGLMTMPAGIGLTGAFAAVWGTFVGVDTVFFVLVVVSMVTNTVLANAIETPVGAVMFQPLPADRRMPVRVAVDGWLGSVALIIAGVLLLAFAAADFDTVLPFVWLLGGIGVVGIWLAGKLYLGYKDELRAATTRAFSGHGVWSINLDDPKLDAIAGGGPASVFTAGALLALGDADDASSHLLESMIEHPDPTIVEVAAQAIESMPDPQQQWRDRLAAVFSRSDVSPRCRSQALLALAKIDADLASTQAGLVTANDDEIVQEVAAAISVGAEPNNGEAASRLRQRVTSAHHNDRASVARTIQWTNDEVDPELILDLSNTLLQDEDEVVRLETLRSLEGRVTPALAPLVLDAGRAVGLRRHAVLALAESEESVLDAVTSVLDDLDPDFRADLIENVYPRHTRRPALLHPFVAPGTPSKIRSAGFTAIQRAGIAPPASPARMIRDDIELAQHLVAAHRDIASQTPAVGWAIDSEFSSVRSSIYRALALDLQANRLHDIQAIAAQSDDEDRANAIEALDVMLPSDLRRTVIPILEPRTIKDAVTELVDLPESRESSVWLEELASDVRLDPWTNRTATYHADLRTRVDPINTVKPNNESESMSELIERIVALKGVDIFATLPYPLLAELAEGVTEKHVAAGETIIEMGALDQELFALTSGRVRVSTATGEHRVLESGTVFGELAVLDPAPRSADVVAETSCVVHVMKRSTLLALADRRPEIMVEIAGVLARRLRAKPS